MRVVVVSYHVGDSHYASSYRVDRLAKYLPRFGHEVFTFAAVSDLGASPHAEVVDPPLALRAQSVAGRALLRLLLPPEPQILWAMRAVRPLCELATKARAEAILISSPPHSIQVLGIRAARRLKLPVIADLRDDWMGNHRSRWRTPIHRLFAGALERRCVNSAARVILNTEQVYRRFCRRYPERAASFSVIPNGFDEDDFRRPLPPGPPPVDDSRASVVYTGSMYGNFMWERLSALAEELIDCGMDRSWRIVSAGPNGIVPPRLGAVWSHRGTLPAETAMAFCREAGLLLLAMPPGEREPSATVPLKAYSYLRSERPILYIGEKGATTELLDGFAGTSSLSRSCWPQVAQWMTTHAARLNRHYERPGLSALSFEARAAQVARLLDSLSEIRETVGRA